MGIFNSIYWKHSRWSGPTTLEALDNLLEDHHWSMIRSTLRKGINIYKLYGGELIIIL